MLIDFDAHVRAAINLEAVFGALPKLAELAPRAQTILAGIGEPVTLSLRAPGSLAAKYTFSKDGIRRGAGAGGPTLLFASAGHVNSVVSGGAQPIPLAGLRGIKFLTGVFTPLTEVLESYLQPSPEQLTDPEFREASTLLTLEVVASALEIVANHDESGQFSVAHMPSGSIALEVGDALSYRFDITAGRMSRSVDTSEPPSAVLRFADLSVAGDVLAGRESSLACVSDGRIAMSGLIPLIDNLNRILDRVGAYLGE